MKLDGLRPGYVSIGTSSIPFSDSQMNLSSIGLL